MNRTRTGTLVVKTVDATLDVVMRDQLRHLRDTSLAPIRIAARDTGRLTRIAEREGVTAHPVCLTRDPSPVDDVRALFALIRLMHTVRPEVVVYGTPKATLLAGIAARVTRVPTRVQVLHGLRLDTATGIGRKILLAVERLSIELSTNTLAVGAGLRHRCAELGLPAHRIDVLGAGSVVGTDVARAAAIGSDPVLRDRVRSSWGAGAEEFVIGFVGRVTRDKGVETLVRAVAVLRSRGIRSRLVLVGLDEGADRLDADVQELLRADWVTRTGNLDDPADCYAGFDVFCLPSHREGLPTVVLEAWACSRAVVSSDCTGLGDLVEDGVTGLVTPVGDTSSTALALERLARDEGLRRRLAAAGRRRAEADFDRRSVWNAFTCYLERARKRQT